MQRASRAPRRPPLAAVLLLATICCFTSNAAAVTATSASSSSSTFSYPVVHRFSDRAKEMLQRRAGGADFGLPWPRRNSAEYHHQLFQLDQARHHARRGRQLSTHYLAFSGDNTTLQWLASLHYTVVDVGTPAVSFFAALDTGSDLTWFPCDCIRCANLDDARIDPQIRDDLNVYSPQSSSTSQNVTCSDSLCKQAQALNCSRATDWCPYVVNYVSADTGTQGNLVRDVLYLGNDLQPTGGPLQTAPVVFGCGRQQTGDFITAAAIDGLVGLGYASEALPSQLARQGLIANSFSVCLSEYDEGRFVFGDKGVPGQSSTPFLAVNNAYVSYTVQAQRITVGSRIITTPGENFFFDTGTSFTYLYSETYQAVTEAFDAEVPSAYVRTQYSGIPFEFCYSGSARANYPYFDHPNITFTWYGGDTMELVTPTLELETQEGRIVGFCLAVTDGGTIALFGQKYMIGYRFTFDREENILGWTKSSCFDQSLAGAEETPPAVSPTLPPPTTAPTPSTTAAPSTPPTGPPVLPPTEAPVLPPSGLPAPPPSASAAPPLVPATSPPPPPPPPRVSTPPPPPQVPPTPTPPRTSTPSPSTSPNSSAAGSSCPVYLLATIFSVLAVAASQFTVHF